MVAPLAGAWIEIPLEVSTPKTLYVAPLAGAWIEIRFSGSDRAFALSLPSRERGLKSYATNIETD